MTTKQLSFKNRTYYFYNDLINILFFEASNLKIDKKASLGIDIYYIGYFDKKPEWSVNGVNPLYLLINRIDGSFEEENGIKYLGITNINRNTKAFKKYDQVFAGIKHHIKKIDDSDFEFEKDYFKQSIVFSNNCSYY